MVDPQSPQCALLDSDLSLTKAVYYDVYSIINGTSNYDAMDRISRSDLRRQLKTVSIETIWSIMRWSASREQYLNSHNITYCVYIIPL